MGLSKAASITIITMSVIFICLFIFIIVWLCVGKSGSSKTVIVDNTGAGSVAASSANTKKASELPEMPGPSSAQYKENANEELELATRQRQRHELQHDRVKAGDAATEARQRRKRALKRYSQAREEALRNSSPPPPPPPPTTPSPKEQAMQQEARQRVLKQQRLMEQERSLYKNETLLPAPPSEGRERKEENIHPPAAFTPFGHNHSQFGADIEFGNLDGGADVAEAKATTHAVKGEGEDFDAVSNAAWDRMRATAVRVHK